jgi:hypothetical protein
MLKKAIEIEGKDDYYVSDLWDLFRNVCEHSVYEWDVWEDEDVNWEYPTPFAYLMKQILSDLEDLFEDSYKQGERPPGRIGYDLIRTWATCVANLGNSKDKVSDRFKYECIGYYLRSALEMMEDYEEADGERRANVESWRDEFVEKLKRYSRGNQKLRGVLFQSMNGLDTGKRYCDYEGWLRSELKLGNRPKPAN